MERGRPFGSVITRQFSTFLALALVSSFLIFIGPGAPRASAALYTTSLSFQLDAQNGTSFTSGDTWNDISGNSNNFTRAATGNATRPIYGWGNGTPNYFLFTRAAQSGTPPTGAMYFSSANNLNTTFAAGSFTVMAWIRVPVANVGNTGDHWNLMHVLSSEVGGLANDWGFGVNSAGKIAFGTGGSVDGTLASGTSVNTDTWLFVAATRTFATNAISIYVNDGAATTGTLSGGANRALTALGTIRMGAGDDGGYSFGGNIGAVYGYTAALTSAQVLQNFNATKSLYGYSSPTTTTIAAANSTTSYGLVDTLTATVSNSAAAGTMDFLSNGTAISGCTGRTVTAGVATCPFLPASTGTLSNITANYLGDGTYDISSSSAITITVTQGIAALAVSASAQVPYRITTAIVATSSPAGTDGKVTFIVDGKRVARCIKLQSVSLTTTCNWLPSAHKVYAVSATLVPTSANFSKVSALPKFVAVKARTTIR